MNFFNCWHSFIRLYVSHVQHYISPSIYLQPNCFPPKVYFPFITMVDSLYVSPSYSLFLFPLWWPLLYSLYLCFLLVWLVHLFWFCLFIFHMWVKLYGTYLSPSDLSEKRLFKCHLRRQSEDCQVPTHCLTHQRYPDDMCRTHICMWIRRIVELFLLFYTMYSSLPLWVREEMRKCDGLKTLKKKGTATDSQKRWGCQIAFLLGTKILSFL